MPPPAPRPIAQKYVWRLLSSDGAAIAAFVFCLLGAIFTPLGAALTIALVTIFVGIPFLLVGIGFLAGGVGLLTWRYQRAQKILTVLRQGSVASAQIIELQQNYNVRVNGRNPWLVRYQFEVNGQPQTGEVATLNLPGPELQPGQAAWALYLPDEPEWNALYPHP